jgi:hypothetical protein
MYILVLLVITGQIGEDTPVFVWFGLDQLSTSMNDVLTQEFNIGDMLLSVVTLLSSAIVVVGTVSAHAKRIALQDIKNPSLKRSLIRAGLYFNKDGKLVKRIEEAVKIDIDGDNKIGDKDIAEFPKENLLQGLKRSGQEFATIVTFKPERIEDVDNLVEENDMIKTAVALQEINESIKESKEKLTLEDAADTIIATKEFLESDDGKDLQTKAAAVIENTGNLISTTNAKVGTGFKKVTGRGIITGLSFLGNNISKISKTTFNAIVSAGTWIKNGITSIGSGLGIFFTNLFNKKSDPEQDEALAKILASRKAEKATIENEERPKQVTQPKVASPAPVPNRVNPKKDPLEALKQKYGK